MSVKWDTNCIRNEIDLIHYCQVSVFLQTARVGCMSVSIIKFLSLVKDRVQFLIAKPKAIKRIEAENISSMHCQT